MVEQRYGRADDVAFRTILGEPFLIVLHAGESKMFSLNGLGLWFWERLESPVSKGDLLGALLAEYEVTAEEAAGEIERFLSVLEEKGLARPVS